MEKLIQNKQFCINTTAFTHLIVMVVILDILAFDNGKNNQGFAHAKLNDDMVMEIVSINTKFDEAFVVSQLDALNPNTSLVIYENVFAKGKMIYKNMPVIKQNKFLKKECVKRSIATRSLLPKQKAIINNHLNTKERKISAVSCARTLLMGTILSQFDEYQRKHDIADAILMIEYIRLKLPEVVKKLFQKEQKRNMKRANEIQKCERKKRARK